MKTLTRGQLLIVTYVLTILFALHSGIPLYATSTYLHAYFNASTVSVLYMTGGVLSLVASIHFSRYLKRFHTYQFTIGISIMEILCIVLFGHTTSLFFLALLFLVHFVLQSVLYVCLNVFVESFSKHANTGTIRGMFLTLFNLGMLTSPLVGGFILSKYSFSGLYIISAVTLVPFIFLVKKYLDHVKEPAYKNIDMFQALRIVNKNKNLKGVLVAALMMECFYGVMIIYSPIYLQAIGIPLSVYMTSILPFALIPLVVLPYELGFLADKKYGEKEILIGGLLVLALTAFLCVIIKSTNPLVWTMLFVFSRVGAACVETMAFAYYFKKINIEDSSLTALFSNTRMLSSVLVGLVGILLSPLLATQPELIFIVLGCAILWSVSYVLPIQDTR